MATMPSRQDTAPRAIESILGQVSVMWLFLDRFESVPSFAEHERIRVVTSQDHGDLRANGKFLGLALDNSHGTFFGVDDDIEYPPDYCATLERHLRRYSGRAVVGLHASIMRPPVASYRHDRLVLHRRSERKRFEEVDVLGSDTVAFRTTELRFDVRRWPTVNMVDLSFALVARNDGFPLVSVPRRQDWVKRLAEDQPDSIYAGLVRDDTRQTVLAHELLTVTRPPLPRVGHRQRAQRLFGARAS
jgi:hypothetical protein